MLKVMHAAPQLQHIVGDAGMIGIRESREPHPEYSARFGKSIQEPAVTQCGSAHSHMDSSGTSQAEDIKVHDKKPQLDEHKPLL